MGLNFKEQLQNVKAFAFDVDGVFSHNIFLHPSGELLRSMNVKDGFAIQYAVKKEYPIAIISGGKCDRLREQFEHLGISDIYMKSQNKIEALHDFLDRYELNPDDILYMGDDLPDYEVMKIVGTPTCPADAAEEIKAVSMYISYKTGGEGCVRDIIEQTLRVQGQWMHPEAFTW